MTSSGKHARSAQDIRVGKHGVAARPRIGIPSVIFAIVLVAIVCLVPLSVAQTHIGLDSQAFADSTRSVFPELSDHIMQEGETSPIENADFCSHVGPKLQNTHLSGGCEIVSLGIALESMGLEADLDAIVQNHLEIDGHYSTGYSGDPYSHGAGYPPGIARAANSYLESQGSTFSAHDLTGMTFEEVRGLVEKGYPVLIWVTMNMDDPQFTGIFDNGAEWYNNEHCVVLYGFEGDQALVSDPLVGLDQRDCARLANVYAECRSMSVAIF